MGQSDRQVFINHLLKVYLPFFFFFFKCLLCKSNRIWPFSWRGMHQNFNVAQSTAQSLWNSLMHFSYKSWMGKNHLVILSKMLPSRLQAWVQNLWLNNALFLLHSKNLYWKWMMLSSRLIDLAFNFSELIAGSIGCSWRRNGLVCQLVMMAVMTTAFRSTAR